MEGENPLQLCWDGELERLERWLSQSGRSLLHYAAASGNTKIASMLLDKEPRLLNSVDSKGNTPLHIALVFGKEEMAEMLLGLKKCLFDKNNEEGATPFLLACQVSAFGILRLLESMGCDVRAVDKTKRSCFHYGCQSPSPDMTVELLLELLKGKGAELVDVPDTAGLTPLHVACLVGDAKLLQSLIESGSHVRKSDHFDNSSLLLAASAGHLALVQLLWEKKFFSDIDQRNSFQQSALHLASAGGHIAVVEFLLAQGADWKLKDRNGETALSLASGLNHIRCVEALLAQSDKMTEKGLLHKACLSGDTELVKKIISKKYDVNEADDFGATPLHVAAYSSGADMVKLLLESGANASVRDKLQCTPLHKAAFSGKSDSLKLLTKGSTSLDLADVDECLALHLAAASRDAASFELILSASSPAALIAKDIRNFLPLHWIASRGSCESASLLLAEMEKSFPEQMERIVNTKNNADKTPLDLAVEAKNFAVALLLRERKGTGGEINMRLLERSEKSDREEASEGRAGGKKDENEEIINRAVLMFNSKPKKGVQYLVSQKIIDETPRSLARFLVNSDNLSKKKVGELLSENDQFSQDLTEAFLQELDFSQLDFDGAMRLFLSKFLLPGEAQKIDRVVELYANRFFEQHSNSFFKNADTCYVLAFAVIMLNTDLHNPAIKKENKMSKLQWQNHVRGVNDGEDLELEFVNELYDHIKTNEIKMESETNMFSNAEKKGFCVKQGGKIRTWKKRYFVLSDHQLFYFRKLGDKSPQGIIPLENLTVEEDSKSVKYGFRLVSKGGAIKAVKLLDGGAKAGNHSFYVIGATSKEEQALWIDAIQQSIHRNPFYELLLKKKTKQNTNSNN